MRFLLLPLLGLFLLGCQYVAPPGGEDAYCYKVTAGLPVSRGGTLVFFTDVEPLQSQGAISLVDAWVGHSCCGFDVSTRFDRRVDYIVLPDSVFRMVRVENRCWP